MVLLDTSIWIRFLAGHEPYPSQVRPLLAAGRVVGHDLIDGELLIGDRGARRPWLALLKQITHLATVPHAEVVRFVQDRHLTGRGIGWVDAHLLAAALVRQVPLWTADQPLAALSRDLRIAYHPPEPDRTSS